jgi:hypothetical protein
MILKVQGVGLNELEKKKEKLQAIVNASAKIFDVQESGNVSLNILNPSKKKNLLFVGHRKSIEVNINQWPFRKPEYNFVGVSEPSSLSNFLGLNKYDIQ